MIDGDKYGYRKIRVLGKYGGGVNPTGQRKLFNIWVLMMILHYHVNNRERVYQAERNKFREAQR